MEQGIRLAKGEDVDALKSEMKNKADISLLENDNYIKKKIVSTLPTLSEDYDFSDGVSRFKAANRCTISVKTETDNNYQSILTASNAANQYAFAYLDFSKMSQGAKRIILDFKSRMHDGGRWYISLSDLSKRPGNSNRTDYDKTGVAFTHGTIDGKYLYINVNNTWKSGYLNTWFNSHIDINLENRTVSYTISNDNPSETLTGELSFLNDDVSEITALEIYSYVNSSILDIDDISIECKFSDDPDERTVYIVQDGSVFTEYIYIDGKPVMLGKSDVMSIIEDLKERVSRLEGGDSY